MSWAPTVISLEKQLAEKGTLERNRELAKKKDFRAKPRTRNPRELPLDTSRFVRPSLVRGKVGQKIVPPMIDKGRMTGDFFTEC